MTPPGYVPIVNTPDGTTVNTGYGLTIRAGISGGDVAYPVSVTIQAQLPKRVGYSSQAAMLIGPNDTHDFIAYHNFSGYQVHVVSFMDSHVVPFVEAKLVQTEGVQVSGALAKRMGIPSKHKAPLKASKTAKLKKGTKKS